MEGRITPSPDEVSGRTLFSRRKVIAAAGGALALGGGAAYYGIRAQETGNDDPGAASERLQVQMVARLNSRRILTQALATRFRNRMSGLKPSIAPAAVYNGLVVFDRVDLDGGGMDFGQDFPRALLELGLARCERIFEYCAGPGYIGHLLMAHGFCEKLTVADINPVAIEAVNHTVSYNRITSLVNVYLSDCLKQIPLTEKWDLIVSNPPHFRSADSRDARDLILHDPAWSVHANFYSEVSKFIKPGGHVVFVENSQGSKPENFEPMIRAGGGTLLGVRPLITLNGSQTPYYYVISKW